MRGLANILIVIQLTGAVALYGQGYGIVDNDPDEVFRVPLDGSPPVSIGILTTDDIFGLAFDSGGTLYGVSADSDSLVVVDPATADVATIGSLDFDASVIGGLTFDPDGVLWLVSDNDLYTVDRSNGHAQLRGHVAGEVEILGLSACSNQLTALYHGGGGEVGLATVDKETLVLEIVNEYFPFYAEPPAGIDWHRGEIYAIENRPDGIILPSPMSWGSFLGRLSPSGTLLDHDWLTYSRSLAFAIGPPPSSCGEEVVEVPALSPRALLVLTMLLAGSGIVFLLKRNV